jgi:alkanesulfonate monooxygenase
LHQVARAAELAGFEGIRIPEDINGDEPWIVAGYVARGSRHLKLLTEFDASRGSSVYAAKNTVSYQRFTDGRFAWQIIAGGDAQHRRALGDFVADDEIIPRIEEFVTVARGVLTQSPYTFKGKYFEVLNGGFQGALANHKTPPVYLSGNNKEALALSAKVADVHIFDAASVNDIKQQIDSLNAAAKQYGRKLGLGLRIDIVARETEQEAIFDARRFWEQSLKKNDSQEPVIKNNLWSGLSTDTTGANATLVGSYQQVTQALVDYASAGITSFLLSSVPHFEEAYRLGEYVLPAVRAQIGHDQRRVA